VNTRSFFDAEAAQWTDRYARDVRFHRRLEKITALIERVAPHPARALDAGCGSGVFSRYLASQGWDVTSFDTSPEMIEEAKSASDQFSIKFLHASVESFSTDDRSFDLILSLSMLEYLEEDEVAIEKFSKLLKPGGILIVSVPNQKGLLRIIEGVVFGIRNATRGRLFGSRGEYLKYQKRQYSPLELGLLMRQHGLRRLRGIFLNAGFAGPTWLLPFFERRWWAAMYCGVYEKR
jgi:SAM-dependent methyltransferase